MIYGALAGVMASAYGSYASSADEYQAQLYDRLKWEKEQMPTRATLCTFCGRPKPSDTQVHTCPGCGAVI